MKMERKKITVYIEAGEDVFWAHSKDMPKLANITGVGDTVEECKKSAWDCLEIQKQLGNIPPGDYDLAFTYDVESFFSYYKSLFTNVSLSRLTGINQHLISHYASGLKKPRPAQRQKIKEGLHKLGRELQNIDL